MKLLIDENNVIKAWQMVGGGWEDTEYTTVEVDEIPDYVIENPEKYCYIDGEYIENPDYIPPEITETITDTDILNALLGVTDNE